MIQGVSGLEVRRTCRLLRAEPVIEPAFVHPGMAHLHRANFPFACALGCKRLLPCAPRSGRPGWRGDSVRGVCRG